MKLSVEVWGPNQSDIEIGLEEALSSIQDGNTSGVWNGHECGYTFAITDEEDHEPHDTDR
jgi:hypothetical protein